MCSANTRLLFYSGEGHLLSSHCFLFTRKYKHQLLLVDHVYLTFELLAVLLISELFKMYLYVE